MAAIALAVRLESGGPILYRERRLGQHGREIVLPKFRTLHADQQPGSRVAAVGDPRITRVGQVLRRTHLDELPQLFRILAGSMSLVGPRPERLAMWQGIDPGLRSRVLAFRPGVTSPASLDYLCEDEVLSEFNEPERLYRDVVLPLKLAADVHYFETRRPVDDLRVLLHTVARLLLARVLFKRDEQCCRRRLRALLVDGDQCGHTRGSAATAPP